MITAKKIESVHGIALKDQWIKVRDTTDTIWTHHHYHISYVLELKDFSLWSEPFKFVFVLGIIPIILTKINAIHDF